MRSLLCFFAACLLLVTTNALAQSKPSALGTWKLDSAQSDFGSDPALKSMTITVLKDTPEMFSWRVREVDEKGKVSTYSWSGPPDGSMHPVMQNGKEVLKESAKKDDQGGLFRHGEAPNGSSFDGHGTMSEGGSTITDEITEKSKDGKESKSKYVLHRVGGAHKTEKKPAA